METMSSMKHARKPRKKGMLTWSTIVIHIYIYTCICTYLSRLMRLGTWLAVSKSCRMVALSQLAEVDRKFGRCSTLSQGESALFLSSSW